RRRHTSFSRDWSSDVCSSDLEAAVPSGPDVVGSCDGARDDGHAGLEDQTDRPEPWGLEPSIPRAFAFDVDPNGLSLAESAECVQIGRASCRERALTHVLDA